jgi:hypothetical protein
MIQCFEVSRSKISGRGGQQHDVGIVTGCMRGSPMFVDCGAWLDLVLPHGKKSAGDAAQPERNQPSPQRRWRAGFSFVINRSS